MELDLSLGFGRRDEEKEDERISGEPPVQLSLLPSAPLPRHASCSSSHHGFPSATDNTNPTRGFDVNRLPSPNFSAAIGGGPSAARSEGEPDRESSEENAMARSKKLRLSKEQSAFLEESFKEHNTLNTKQKLALANNLNLRPRQVEVWFQNRRARTKLKQTEVDCEYLKRCCETLTEENRRLNKELTDLRALKTTTTPFFMQLPATTLSMCPSCERTTTTTTSTAAATAAATAATNSGGHNSNIKGTNSFASLFGKKKPRFYPFVPHPATSPAS